MNSATIAVNQWLSNSRDCYDAVLDIVQEATKVAKSEEDAILKVEDGIRELVWRYVDEHAAHGLVAALVFVAISHVSWRELASYWIDEVKWGMSHARPTAD